MRLIRVDFLDLYLTNIYYNNSRSFICKMKGQPNYSKMIRNKEKKNKYLVSICFHY